MDRLSRLIEDVYGAAAGERPWDDLAPEIARTFGSTSTTLQIQRQGASSTILAMTDNVRAGIDDYRAHYWQRDIWVDRAVAMIGLSRVGASADLVPDHEFEETEFYQDWCRHLGVFYVVGAVFPTGPGELGVLGIHRSRSAGTYDARDKRLVSQFLPHLQRALRLRERLGESALVTEATRAVLSRCQTAVLVVTGDGRVLHANPDAVKLLEDGSAIRSRHGRISASREVDAAQLLALIRAASCTAAPSTPQEGVMLVRRSGGAALSALVAPFRISIPGAASSAAIIFVRDPARGVAVRGTLQTLFKLTPTEARIAEGLAHGKSVEGIAAQQHSSLETVRKQIKTVFAKTGTHRQAECAAMILRSVATMAREA